MYSVWIVKKDCEDDCDLLDRLSCVMLLRLIVENISVFLQVMKILVVRKTKETLSKFL